VDAQVKTGDFQQHRFAKRNAWIASGGRLFLPMEQLARFHAYWTTTPDG
jgi:hypothetical protein